MQIPVRKCYSVLKIAGLFGLVVTVLLLFEQWRGGQRSAGALFLDAEEAEFERQIQEDEARIVPGLGDGGVGVDLTGKEKEIGEASVKKNAMNVYLSDRIPYNRKLKDERNPACARVVYDAELPSASVVIIFHNEPYSVVVRTIWSVLNSARRTNPWFQQANFVDANTGKSMAMGYPGQDPKSQFIYLKEIILVDDNSTLPELKGKLSHYVRTRLPPDLIRILRLPDRVGLTQARLTGARYALGDVIIFLDAHCEVTPDWLRPLLHRIREAPHAVVMPIIDVVEETNFLYSLASPDVFEVGGFTFNGHFTWVNVPEREKRRRGSDIAPTWSPTMAGGLFAIDRKYYWELGAYDEQMGGWGGENLEISFRIWMCGGTLETIPCSRVGHVFRAFHPYGLPYHTDTHGINTARMAEVWMDDYKELFYMHRPDLRKNPKIGDVTHRKVLREKLQCKSFQWYLDNIYKEKFVPVRDAVAYGRFRNPVTSLCIDSLQRDSDHAPLGVYSCHPTLQASQFFMLSHDGELRDEESCAELTHYRRDKDLDEAGYKVNMVDCGSPPHRDQKQKSNLQIKVECIAHRISRNKELDKTGYKVQMWHCQWPPRRTQTWKYLATLQLQHEKSGLCLDAGTESGADLLLKPCRKGPEQLWTVDYTADNHYRMADEDLSMERDMKLNRIRGHRMGGKARVPRSAGEGGRGDHDGSRRRSHRGRHGSKKHGKRKRSHSKTKNKFILKLVRTLMNNTEEHLEVDIHCRHKRLYPNNTFVRDLVTILNEKNIKVINNGRVFERNRVTDVTHDLGRHKEAKILEKLDIPEPMQKPEPVQIPDLRTQTRRWRIKPRKKASPAEPAQERPAPADEKRIIVEDFVEVKPSPSTDAPVVPQREVVNEPLVVSHVMREVASEPATSHASPGEHRRPWTAAAPPDTQVVQQHLKRRHKHVPRATPEPAPPPVQETVLAKEVVKEPPLRKVVRVKPRFHESEEDIMKIEQTSLEDAPMVSGEAAVSTKRDGYSLDSDLENVSAVQHPREDTTTAEPEEPPAAAAEAPHRRSKHKHGDGHRKLDSFIRQDYTKQQSPPAAPPTDTEGGGATASPLKVVMRSNLTFNLGDEFFNWRGDDDVTNLVDELSIPRAPPAQAWLRAPPQRAGAGAGDATATASSGGNSGSSGLERPGPDLVPASAYVTALRSRIEPHREAPGGAAPASYDEESESTSDSGSSELP